MHVQRSVAGPPGLLVSDGALLGLDVAHRLMAPSLVPIHLSLVLRKTDHGFVWPQSFDAASDLLVELLILIRVLLCLAGDFLLVKVRLGLVGVNSANRNICLSWHQRFLIESVLCEFALGFTTLKIDQVGVHDAILRIKMVSGFLEKSEAERHIVD